MSVVMRFLRRPVASSVIAVLMGLVVAAVILALGGFDPLRSFATLVYGALGQPKYLTNVIIKATPILLTGVSVAFAFNTGLFNIGAEGQYIAGTIVATIVGVTFDLPAPLQIPLVVLSGALAGAALGAFVGFLKARFGIHEVITSIMCNWIAMYACNLVVSSDAFHNPNSNTALPVNPSSYTMILPQWKMSEEGIAYLLEHPLLKDILLKTDLNVGFIIAVLVAVLAHFVLSRTKLGYELRVVGYNRDAARFSGIGVQRSVIVCMLIAGGISGLAGALAITGISPHTIYTLGAQEGYGFSGLSVAFIAGCSSVGCIFSSLLFSALLYGGGTVQQMLGVPSEIINIMIGVIVFCTAFPPMAPKIANWLEVRKATRGSGKSQSGEKPQKDAHGGEEQDG